MAALAVLPLYFYALWLPRFGSGLALDMTNAYVPAAEDVLAGRTPYPTVLDTSALRAGEAYVYPPLLAVVLTPFAMVPDATLPWVGVVSALAATGLALWLLGVRDWRVYGAVALWAPTFNAVQTANVSALLVLLLAAAWHLRDSRRACWALGAAAALKLFVWPLLLWPAVVGNRLHAAIAAAAAGALVIGSWAVIGFADFLAYPDLVQRLAEIAHGDSYSVWAAMVAIGASETVARMASAVLCCAFLGLMVRFGRRRDETRVVASAVGAALAFSPLAWLHYLTLLVIPMALTRPRFGLLWLVPIVLWMCPQSGNGVSIQTLLAPTVAIGLITACLHPSYAVGAALRSPIRARL